MSSLDFVVARITTERNRQREKGYTDEHDDQHSVCDWSTIIRDYCQELEDIWLDGGEPDELWCTMLQLSAVSVAALQSMYRKGMHRYRGLQQPDTPRYEFNRQDYHTYLGNWNEYDLWFASSASIGGSTRVVIARHGSGALDFINASVDDTNRIRSYACLAVAVERAKQKGLF